LLKKLKNRLVLLGDVAPPARGGTTRINEFFYVNNETIKSFGIDPEFCLPLIKSPGETNTIHIDTTTLELKVFVCHKTKELLRDTNQLGTLAYIEWGEEQEYKDGIQRGMKWPNGPWVKNRVPGWYSLPLMLAKYSFLKPSEADTSRNIHNNY
jgi:hypothetical protein